MSYQYLGRAANGNSRYRLTLNVYRDCFQSEVPLDPEIELGVYYNNETLSRNQVVKFVLNAKTKVQPPGSVDCDFYAKNVCIEYGLYEGVIELPNFNGGYHITFVRCCRNKQTNLPNSGGTPYQGQTYYCYIPNTNLENSSPIFSGVPSPYMCAKDTTTFLFNAIDPDGDELSYKIVRPFQGGSTTANGAMPSPPANLSLPIDPVVYNPGYNELYPFGTTNGSITSIDAATGLTTFMSPNIGSYVVGVEVTERRNGEILSTIRMDLQILVLDCPPNEVPNVKVAGGDYFRIEAGEPLCFDVTASDPDGDVVKLSGKGPILEGGALFDGTLATFANAAAQRTVTSEFCWTPDCDVARDEPYQVTFNVEDDGCPPKFNYITVQIKVDPFEGTDVIDGPDQVCQNNTYTYQALGGRLTSTYEWEVTNGVFVGGSTGDIVQVKWTGTGNGTLRMREVSQYGCPGEWVDFPVTIAVSPPTPVIQGKDTVCVNETGLSYSVTLNAGNSYDWSIDNGTFSSEVANSVNIGTYNKPSFTLYVVETNSTGCASDTGKLEVYVSDPLPTVDGPASVCPNSSNVLYTANGPSSSSYNWSVSGGVLSSANGSNSMEVDWGNAGNGSITVVETNRFGCVSPPITLSVLKTYILEPTPITGPNDVCENELGVPYQTLQVNGNVYTWTITGGSQASGDSSNAITVDWGAPGSGSVTVVQKAYDLVNNRLCLSPPVVKDVTIHPIPTADIISGPVELCQSESASYTLNGFANSTYSWSIDGDTSGITGQGTNTIDVTWTDAGSFTLSVIETSGAGCDGEPVDLNITINPTPNTSPIQGEVDICPENASNQIYQVIGLPNSTFNWEVYGAKNFSGQGSDQINVNWEPSVSLGRINVVEMSDKGCPGDTVKLNVNIERLVIDMSVVSVGDPDDRMYISWGLPYGGSPDEFIIEKRVAGSTTWTEVDRVPGYVFDHLETNINTDVTAFEYRILAVNQCGTMVNSENHTSILLTGFQDEQFNITLSFTDYFGWMNGVSDYTLYESTNDGPYQQIRTGEIPNQSIVLGSNSTDYKKCYRILATELFGEETRSWSNDICFYFTPEVYVPNAFTPNGDGKNDEFGVVGIAVNEFLIQIYNRWGEMIYESDDINGQWVPEYRGEEVMMGTYIYLIKYTDSDENIYIKKGTINLLR